MADLRGVVIYDYSGHFIYEYVVKMMDCAGLSEVLQQRTNGSFPFWLLRPSSSDLDDHLFVHFLTASSDLFLLRPADTVLIEREFAVC